MSMTDNAPIAYLKFVLQHLRLSPSALAKKAGVSPSTLTRPLNNPDHNFVISTSTLQKISEATGINPAPFFEAKDSVELSFVPMRAETYSGDKWLDNSGPMPRVTLVVGYVEAGAWREPEVVSIEEQMPLLIAPSGYSPEDCFGLVVADESVNDCAMQSDVLVCVRAAALKWRIGDGTLVIVERRRGNLIELTARAAFHENEKWVLHLPTSSRKFSKVKSIELKSLHDGEDGVKILGEVVYIVRDVPRMMNRWSQAIADAGS